ncbi:hypothetical protein [Rhodococcus wratislaviensis]|uniref:hypothetical protein n=1 Tax=Rhodococcus wratislaviensis TaxID=44752 RepID=UPI003513067F
MASIASRCADAGLAQYLLDGGPHVLALLHGLRDDQVAGRWHTGWESVSTAFLDRLVEEDH